MKMPMPEEITYVVVSLVILYIIVKLKDSL